MKIKYKAPTSSVIPGAGANFYNNEGEPLGGLVPIKGYYNSADDDSGNFITDTLSSITGIDFGKISDQVAQVFQAVKGRTYTTGKYKAAEKYIRHVLGQNITSNTQVPDDMVDTALTFFTNAFGIPITTVEDLDNIDPNYNTSGHNVQDYKQRDPAYGEIPDSLVERAVKIKRQLPYSSPKWDFAQAYKQAGISASNVSGSVQPGNLLNSILGTGGSTSGASGNILLIIGGVVLAIIVIVLIVKLAKR